MPSSGTVAFHTLGCKLNFSESSTLGRQLEAAGYRRVRFEEAADVYVINTCSVTDHAERKCRAAVRRARSLSPDAFVAVVGCYAQLRPGEIAAISGVDMVLGAADKFSLAERIRAHVRGRSAVHACAVREVRDFVPSHSVGDRTRSFLKVQDGCDYHCAFCTIPMARGRSRSGTVSGIVRSAREIAGQGVKEIVLTGVNIGDFGRRSQRANAAGSSRPCETFYDLVEALEDDGAVPRYRISSIEPNLLEDRIIELVAASKHFMPHFHIPLQSGSDRILRLMRRKYVRSLYEDRVRRIMALMPHACIGADVITGFPGETEEDFAESYDFLGKLDISYLHVFTYSERPGTTALRLEDPVPVKERQRRTNVLRGLSEDRRGLFCRQHEGSVREVLWESENDDGRMYGFTDNYIRLQQPFREDAVNRVESVAVGEEVR